MLIALDDLALGVGDRGGEQERAVQMEPRIEGFLVEGLSLRLIPGWKFAPRSGSYHIEAFSLLANPCHYWVSECYRR